MKSKNLFILITLILLATLFSIYAINPKKSKVEENLVFNRSEIKRKGTALELEKNGFSKSSSIIELKAFEEKSIWAKKGFVYYTNSEVNKILEENNFIIGPANTFLGIITNEAANKIADNYTKIINDIDNKYLVKDGRRFTEEEVNDMPEPHYSWVKSFGKEYKDVFVIAPEESFDKEGTVLDSRELKLINKDPIALVKGNFGYIELAKW